MIKAVLFDMDGVLVDTEWFYNRRRVAFMEEKGFHFDEIPDLSGSNEPAIWEALVPDDVELRERLRVEYKHGGGCGARRVPGYRGFAFGYRGRQALRRPRPGAASARGCQPGSIGSRCRYRHAYRHFGRFVVSIRREKHGFKRFLRWTGSIWFRL